ncbi:hypothetical protein [Nocardia tengchongensis]|uniref:hypothetical protein n=1 Tax=Nocardia tengchongensis TaxID=2055889 RepID=UPI00367CF8E2
MSVHEGVDDSNETEAAENQSAPADGQRATESETRPLQVSWAKLPYLAAHHPGLPVPTIDGLGVGWIHKVCDRLYFFRSADHFEPDITVPIAESQWRESRALAGSIAESLMLGTAGLVEVVWLEEGIAAGELGAAWGMGQRYFADALCETSIAVGHRLINFVARMMRTDPETQQRMDEFRVGGQKPLEPLGTRYMPFKTEERNAWLSLNAKTISQLRAIASPQTDLAAAVNRLADLEESAEWRNAFEHRAENFHRWRREHEYVAGVDQASGGAQDELDYAGNVSGKRFGGSGARYSAADGLGDQAVVNARSGLEATARAADDILTHILDALSDLTRGMVIELTGTGVRVSRRRGTAG